MNVRLIIALPLVLLVACPGATPAPDTEPQADTVVAVDLGVPDLPAPPTGAPCCAEGVCSAGSTCVDGACLLIPGALGCYRDGDCDPGQACVEPAPCPCETPDCTPKPGQCLYPEGCCNSDDDCESSERCLTGQCWAKPAGTLACREDNDCGKGYECDGAKSCVCGDATCTPEAGVCSVPGACCASDGECGPDGRCVGEACVSIPSDGACHADGDCAEAGAVCAGASVCVCGASGCDIPTTKGACHAAGSACCVSASDCGVGKLCVEGKACVTTPSAGTCYVDDHCGPGAVCDGASVCATCDPACTDPPVAGTCRTLGVPCEDNDACSVGMRCVAPDRLSCPATIPDELSGSPTPKVCVADVANGCWNRADCGPGERCAGVEICTDPAGCNELNRPGQCMALGGKDQCCASHFDCADGFECRNSNTSLTCPPTSTSVCLPKPQYGLTCWNYKDCPESQVCIKARICACGARCFKSSRGFCEPASKQTCNADIDCGDNYSCARDLECVVNPCFSTNDCPLGGLCKPDVPGSCWTHQECGKGSYCKGLRVCPADATCPEVDKPGLCAVEEEAGGCCDSYFACGTGLRCVSAVSKTSCKLDVSAICVPFGVFNSACYTDEECSPNRECAGQQMCACGLEGCDAPPKPGSCVLK